MKTIPVLLVSAITSTQSQFYAVTTEIGMPNLEENLRYTVQHEQVCLTPDALYHRFPILNHPALANCHLGEQSENSYRNTVSAGLRQKSRHNWNRAVDHLWSP